MKISSTFDTNMQLLAKVLDLRAQNQQVIAANIANAETPGYKPAKLEFEQELQQAVGSGSKITLASTNEQHIAPGSKGLEAVSGTISFDAGAVSIGDGNSVDVEQEMLTLAENELLYEAAAQLLRKKLGMIRYAVSGGQ